MLIFAEDGDSGANARGTYRKGVVFTTGGQVVEVTTKILSSLARCAPSPAFGGGGGGGGSLRDTRCGESPPRLALLGILPRKCGRGKKGRASQSPARSSHLGKPPADAQQQAV